MIDLGWEIQIGDWRPDPTKFPNGLNKLVDLAHDLGIKFGLYIPLPQVYLSFMKKKREEYTN